MKRRLFHIICLLLCSQLSFGQHQFYSGHIELTYVLGLDVSVTLELCAAMGTDLSQVSLCFGDGSCHQPRLIEQEDFPTLGIQKLKYTIDHSYPSLARYVISFEACCWNDGKNTEALANSKFFIYHEFTLYNPQFLTNLSPTLESDFDVFVVAPSIPLSIVPLITDVDADSFQLSLVSPEGDSLVNNAYVFPDEADRVDGNDFLIDGQNSVQWDAPEEEGVYHFAYKLKEYRQDDELSTNYGISTIIVQDSESTAVNETNPAEMALLYPNPTRGDLNISGEGPTEIFVYNLHGCLLLHQDGVQGDLSMLPNGIYFVRVLQNGKTYTGKVIKV
ncbi:MAG: T9SS type A sorting domain-containing protein [Bacteroidota bacterium]